MDELNSEIKILRCLWEESNGQLSREKEKKLRRLKNELSNLLGANVTFPEDRIPVPTDIHQKVVFLMKNIDWLLKGSSGAVHDGKLYHQMYVIFNFEVSDVTIRRYYYMSEEAEKNGK